MIRPVACWFLLQTFLFFNKAASNSIQIPSLLTWMPIGSTSNEPNLESTQKAIASSGVFRNVNTDNIHILGYGSSDLEKEFVLALCKIVHNKNRNGSGIVFYAAVTQATQDESTTNIVLNSIGGISKVTKSNTNEIAIQVRHAAEIYSKRRCAFQPVWQSFESFEKNCAHLKDCISLTKRFATKSGTDILMEINKYWIVEPNSRTVILYANMKENKGAYVTVALSPILKTFEIIKYEMVERFANTYEALSVCLDSGLAFEQGWELSSRESEALAEEIETQLRRYIPWIPKDLALALFARNVENDNFLGTIFKTSGLYGANTLFAIWGFDRKYLIHVSLPATLEETLSSYRSYCATKLWQSITSSGGAWGLWADKQEKEPSSYFSALIKSIPESSLVGIELADYNISSVYGLLPNSRDTDYKSVQIFCVILLDLDNQNFYPALIKFKTSGSDKARQVTLENVERDKPSDNISAATALTYDLLLTLFSTSLAWIKEAPKDFHMSHIETSCLLSRSKNFNKSVKWYSANDDKLLVILEMHIDDNKRPCFMALKKIGNKYQVTWVGELRPDRTEDDTRKAKLQAEVYHYRSFAYGEEWKSPARNLNEVDPVKYSAQSIEKDGQNDGQASPPMGEQDVQSCDYLELCSWDVPNTKLKISIYGYIEGDGFYSSVYYQQFLLPQGASTHLPGPESQSSYWIGDMLESLSLDIDNPVLYSENIDKNQKEKLKGNEIQSLVGVAEAKYSSGGALLFKSLILPTYDLTKAVLVFCHEPSINDGPPHQNLTPRKPRKLSEEVYILVPMLRSLHLTDAGIRQRKYDCAGEITKSTFNWLSSVETLLLDPLTFTPEASWKTSSHLLREGEVGNILLNAPWKTSLSKVLVLHEKKTDWFGNKFTFYICGLDGNDTNSKFLLVYNYSEMEEILYIGGLGNIRDVERDYGKYITSVLAFEKCRFHHGIAWYDKKSSPVENFTKIIYDFLETEYLKLPKGQNNSDASKIFKDCHFGRISTAHGVNADNGFTYCIFGKINPDSKQAHYTSILINVRETMHGAKCLGFQTDAPHHTMVHASSDLAKFIEQYHSRPRLH